MSDKQALDEVKRDFLHLSKYPLPEPIVKMVVLSPPLKLAGFYRLPYFLAAEKDVEIVSEDEGTIVRGRIDILVFQPQFWITVIEAKKIQYLLEVGVPPGANLYAGKPCSRETCFWFDDKRQGV